MGLLDSLKAWLSREAAEAKDLGQRTKGRLESDLDRREVELNLTPEERLERLQEQIEEDSSFSALQDKIEGREALADAKSELSDLERQGEDDLLDLDSEEIIPPEAPEV